MRPGQLHADERSLQIDPQQKLQGVQGQLGEGSQPGIPCVVEQHIQTPEALQSRVHDPLPVRFAGDVLLHEHGLAAQLVDHVHGHVAALHVASCHHQLGTRLHHGQGATAADA